MADLIKKESATNATNSLKARKNNKKQKAKSQENTGIYMPEPWAEPVDGMQLVQEMRDMFQRYLVLPDGASTVLPLWVLHTYSVDSFYYTPRLCIYSPVPRCGKTQLLQLLEMTTYRPLNTSGITAAGIFRIIESMHPTLLIDEADCYLNGDATIRSVINAGYKKGGKVIRNVDIKNDYIPKTFDCYSAMAIAGIGMRDTTIMDRSIIIIMNRRKPTDTIEKLRPDTLLPYTEQLRSMSSRFMNDNASAIAEIIPDMPKFLNDRASDIWEPLFAMAQHISPDLVADLTYAANKLIPVSDDGDDIGIQLLFDIRQIFDETNIDFIPSGILAKKLCELDNRPWGEIQYGKQMLNPIKLAQLLQVFQIKPMQKRQKNTRMRGYELVAFADAFERYLPDITCDSVTSQALDELSCHDVTGIPEPPIPNKPENTCTESDENMDCLDYDEYDMDEAFAFADDFMNDDTDMPIY